MQGYSEERNSKELTTISKLAHALNVQEKFYKEKFRNQWLELGDMCTKFFHLEAYIKALRKNISSMMIDGTVVEDQDLIADHVVSYYKNMYRQSSTRDNDLINETILSLVTEEHNAILCIVPNEEEIKVVIFSMNASRSPGPNDFGVCFYKACWNIISGLILFLQYSFSFCTMRC